ncbi:MAG TPA: alginate lyase family protein [Ktedonobacterales bacterium]|nr:alginate lyase family protein [Ktedonobacterales bacterium]
MSHTPDKSFLTDGEKALAMPLLSVTQSPIIAPSGDIHDYVTLATYAWRNPDSPDGLPYIIRDGETNPETERYPDRKNVELLITSIRHLASAYRASQDERYARKAIELLGAWFLAGETRMNPNLNYAQIVPGHNNGLGTAAGIIETHNFVDLLESLEKLESSASVTPQCKDPLSQWLTDYLSWLQTSPNGLQAAQFKNNQLTWYLAQQVAIAWFLGNTGLAKSILKNALNNTLPAQFDEAGLQPYEITRTNSFHYSLVNLQGWFALARLGNKMGMDVWYEQAGNGASLSKAFDFLLPYATAQSIWPYQEIRPYDLSLMTSLLKQAEAAYPEKSSLYETALAQLKVF